MPSTPSDQRGEHKHNDSNSDGSLGPINNNNNNNNNNNGNGTTTLGNSNTNSVITEEHLESMIFRMMAKYMDSKVGIKSDPVGISPTSSSPSSSSTTPLIC
jgi:hypothetical protein